MIYSFCDEMNQSNSKGKGITRGNPIMLLPLTSFRVLPAYVSTRLQDSWPAAAMKVFEPAT
jgi:hypothetical protein